MSTLAHPTAHPPLRLLERPARRARPASARPAVAAPSLLARLDAWLATLPEPRNRLGVDARV
jgi:hypothetical protein